MTAISRTPSVITSTIYRTTVAVLQFDFTPQANRVFFEFVFASGVQSLPWTGRIPETMPLASS